MRMKKKTAIMIHIMLPDEDESEALAAGAAGAAEEAGVLATEGTVGDPEAAEATAWATGLSTQVNAT